MYGVSTLRPRNSPGTSLDRRRGPIARTSGEQLAEGRWAIRLSVAVCGGQVFSYLGVAVACGMRLANRSAWFQGVLSARIVASGSGSLQGMETAPGPRKSRWLAFSRNGVRLASLRTRPRLPTTNPEFPQRQNVFETQARRSQMVQFLPSIGQELPCGARVWEKNPLLSVALGVLLARGKKEDGSDRMSITPR
jgi:hypothetical protein